MLYRHLLEQTEDTEYYKNLAETVSDAVKTYSLAYPCSTFDREGRNTRVEFAVIDYALTPITQEKYYLETWLMFFTSTRNISEDCSRRIPG